ncbi:MAG TPA: HD domain-containing phosphohydrolase [Fimbriimonas sp.]|nr:HD domain-containing phosphohydrolase [Fimbriimonas sp.]
MRKNQLYRDAHIVVIDDVQANVAVLKRTLEWAKYKRVSGFSDPQKALETFRNDPPDIILLDLHMPGLDGFQVLDWIKYKNERNDYVPVLVLTADANAETRRKALSLGADDFLTKPYDATEVMLRVHNFLETRWLHKELENKNADLESLVQRRTKELEQARMEALETLARAAEFRDDNTGEHAKRVGDLSARIAEAAGQDSVFVELIRMAAPLHDVGKIGVPDAVLLKPAKLDKEEFEIMKSHSEIGGRILAGSESPVLKMGEEIALSHHEKWDGSGYPLGLKGDEIPLSGRIVALADVYDALTSERPYKRAWRPEEAYRHIEESAGAHFDPRLVEAFWTLIEREELQVAA